jgi:cobalt-zinc-cadmium efflux system protein
VSSHAGHRHDHHDHQHAHRGERVSPKPLTIALLITTGFMILEVVGGLLTNSLALLADAGHMLTDAAALALALFAIWLARRPATPERSFGFLRAEVLAAFINAVTLVVMSIFIFIEAFRRFGEPPEVDSGPMLAVAFAGLAANAASAWVLSRGGGHQHNLNTRGAFLHVVGDMLGSVGAIVAALVMMATGWYLADPILSSIIGLLILRSAWFLLKESVDVLLDATPQGIDSNEVRGALAEVDGVCGVHDLHIWTVTSGLDSMSAHVQVNDTREWNDVVVDLTDAMRDRFGIAHVTLQPESCGGGVHVTTGECSLDTVDGRRACITALEEGHHVVSADAGHHHH